MPAASCCIRRQCRQFVTLDRVEPHNRANQEIKAQYDSAYDAVSVAQDEVMEAKPVTPAGAISLLRFVAELIEGESLGDDDEEHYAMAIRNAADFFERSASA